MIDQAKNLHRISTKEKRRTTQNIEQLSSLQQTKCLAVLRVLTARPPPIALPFPEAETLLGAYITLFPANSFLTSFSAASPSDRDREIDSLHANFTRIKRTFSSALFMLNFAERGSRSLAPWPAVSIMRFRLLFDSVSR